MAHSLVVAKCFKNTNVVSMIAEWTEIDNDLHQNGPNWILIYN